MRGKLPPRPDGFLGKCDDIERMPLTSRPHQLSDNLVFIAKVEWDWEICHTRPDKCYLDAGEREWFIWRMVRRNEGLTLDVTEEGFPKAKFILYAYGGKANVTEAQAAIFHLEDTWSAKRDGGLERFHCVSNGGFMITAEIDTIGKVAW